MRGNLFSESWYKVADLHVSLLDAVETQKQYYRGRLWYVLHDPYNNNYFRVTPEAHNFISMLRPDKTVKEIWEECLEICQERAPSQEEVLGLLSQLHVNDLLYFKNPPNNEFIFERHREKKQKELQNKVLSIIAIKIPLWNPDKWLSRILPLINLIFSFKGLCIWFLVLMLGSKAIVDNFNQIYDQTQGMLSRSNLVYFYLSLAFLKSFHELGHAMMNKRFGGPVPTLGLMFLVFTPLPYTDATSSWFFQNRWHRLLVDSAGMISDLFFAALAAVVWANTGDGLIHSLAFNVMIIGSVSSVAFNGNPLIRFDAYYMLSDFLEIPNLYQRARGQWIYWIEKKFFHLENLTEPAESSREAVWLTVYGLCSLVYRVFLTVAIVLFVADKIFALGLILAIVSIVAGILRPLKTFIVYLSSSPRLGRSRKRAVAISASMAAAFLLFTGLYPIPYAIRAPGIVESKGIHKVYATTEGELRKVNFRNGEFVKKGEIIAVLFNYELELEIKATKAGLSEMRALVQKAIFYSTADLKPLYEREKVLKEQLTVLEQKKRDLTVIAQNSGIFVAPDLESLRGRWLKRQTLIGSLIADGEFRFYAIVSQEQASDLFREKYFQNQVKLYGDAKDTLELNEIVVIPFQREELPSAALGWFGGGDISVSGAEKSGKKVTEPFFEINGKIIIPADSKAPNLLHGRSGVLRLTLPPEPLSLQGYRWVKQTIQKRYKI